MEKAICDYCGKEIISRKDFVAYYFNFYKDPQKVHLRDFFKNKLTFPHISKYHVNCMDILYEGTISMLPFTKYFLENRTLDTFGKIFNSILGLLFLIVIYFVISNKLVQYDLTIFKIITFIIFMVLLICLLSYISLRIYVYNKYEKYLK